MKEWSSGRMLNVAGWGSFVWIFILLPFPTVTRADSNHHHNISLSPNSQAVCKIQTVIWSPTNASSYTVRIVEIVDQATLSTLFQAVLSSPTTSVEWVVKATGGASLQLTVFTPGPTPDSGAPPYLATGFNVPSDLSGLSTCINSGAGVLPPITTPSLSGTGQTPSTSLESSASPVSSTSSQTSLGATTQTASPSTLPPTGTSSESSASASSSETSTSSSKLLTSHAETSRSSSTYTTSSTTSPPANDTPPPASEYTSHSPSRALSQGAIGAVVAGSLVVIAFVLLARCLLRRRTRARRRAAGAQALAVSPYPSYLGWLPRKSQALRSSYQTSQAESLCSDSQLSVSEVELKQPLAAWNPRRFVRSQAEAATNAAPRAQPRQESALTPETVASVEESEVA